MVGYVLAGMVFILMGYLLYRNERIQSSQRALASVLAESSTNKNDTLEMDLDDVRILGDAITKGTRTADAMLILQKLNLWLLPVRKDEALNVEALDHYDQLTTSEKKILKDMLARFDAKEIARIMKVSPAYIYNSRSKIRQKLEIPRDLAIEDWVISKAQTFDAEGH